MIITGLFFAEGRHTFILSAGGATASVGCSGFRADRAASM